MNNKTIKSAVVIVLGATIAFVSGCSPSGPTEKVTFIEKRVITMEDTLPNGKKVEGDAHGGKYFSRADSNVYGCGIYYKLPDSLMQKDLRIKLNAWVRIGDLAKDKKYAISLEDGNSKVIAWEQIEFKSHVAEANKWVNVIDSVTIAGNLINNSGLFIKTYSFNPEGHSTLDVDDLEISIFKVEKIAD